MRAHLVADVPVGVLLSGGVDSGGLAALAARELGAPLRTFTVGFDEPSFDELADARLVARRYGTDHRELVVGPEHATLLSASRATPTSRAATPQRCRTGSRRGWPPAT